jgi:DNA-directed RNA polymerase specialized sigma24 family protein
VALSGARPSPPTSRWRSRPREALRALSGLRRRRRHVLEPKLAGFSYREIMELLGVIYTNVNRHLSEGRTDLRRAA